jgi:hypothetical protein
MEMIESNIEKLLNPLTCEPIPFLCMDLQYIKFIELQLVLLKKYDTC